MPRPRKQRFVQQMPIATIYKPIGISARNLPILNLSVEELEALNLADVIKMEQEDAAEEMAISRPTFSRILASARTTVAEALVKGYAISINGGDFVCVEDMAVNKFKNGPQCGPRYGQRYGQMANRTNMANIETTSLASDIKALNKENLRVVVSCVTPDLDSQVDPRFGRAEHFLIIDPKTMQSEHIDNSRIQNTETGAGIQTATLISQKKVDVILTGFVGPKAASILATANIIVLEGFEGFTVIEAIKKLTTS
jgi:uncharacterized protein